MICSSVPQFASLAPPDYPPTVYSYWGTGCLVFCAMARAKTFRVLHTLVVPVRGRSAAGSAKNAEEKVVGHLGECVGLLARGEGAASRWPP